MAVQDNALRKIPLPKWHCQNGTAKLAVLDYSGSFQDFP
jgi:hypothetical protein